MSVRDQILAAFALSAACAACGPSETPTPPPAAPQATVTFSSKALEVDANLVLQDATMRLSHVHVFGDTPQVGPSQGPPTGQPTDRLDFDALAAAGGMLTFAVPQGLYSRVEFQPEHIVLDGKWKGVTFHALLASVHGPRVDRRTSALEALPDGTIAFAVTTDPNTWFANGGLDGATTDATTGEIFCDDLNNPALAGKLMTQIDASFALR
jgi:hypothetical protein